MSIASFNELRHLRKSEESRHGHTQRKSVVCTQNSGESPKKRNLEASITIRHLNKGLMGCEKGDETCSAAIFFF